MNNLFIWYPKCSTCRDAKKWLDENNITYILRDIVLETPTKEELTRWITESNLEIKNFFNTSGLKYKELNLKNKLSSMTADERIELLSSEGMLIKRPLFIGNVIIPGFKNYEKIK